MVLNQMGFVLATFVRRFEGIENRDEEMRFVEEYMFSVQSRNGVKVAFKLEKTCESGVLVPDFKNRDL